MEDSMTNTKKLNKQTFTGEIASGVSLVDFYAEWCPPCKALAPTYDGFAVKHGAHYTVAKVDIDESAELAQQFGVRSIPTIIAFKDGVEVERLQGSVSLNQLEGLAQKAEGLHN